MITSLLLKKVFFFTNDDSHVLTRSMRQRFRPFALTHMRRVGWRLRMLLCGAIWLLMCRERDEICQNRDANFSLIYPLTGTKLSRSVLLDKANHSLTMTKRQFSTSRLARDLQTNEEIMQFSWRFY